MPCFQWGTAHAPLLPFVLGKGRLQHLQWTAVVLIDKATAVVSRCVT
jgi:hypothetical protein